MGCPKQEYWSGLSFPSPEDLPDPGTEPASPALQADYLPVSHLESSGLLLGGLNSLGLKPTTRTGKAGCGSWRKALAETGGPVGLGTTEDVPEVIRW